MKDFRECLATGVPFLVAVAAGNDVVGYAIAHAVADEGEILNLGVAAVHRRQGVGRRLVLATMEALAARGARTVYLEVRESNAAARGLYQQLGFGEVGRRSRYYRQPVEDAILLRAAISAKQVMRNIGTSGVSLIDRITCGSYTVGHPWAPNPPFAGRSL